MKIKELNKHIYIRLIIFEIIFLTSFLILIIFTQVENFNKKEILNIIISVISIIIAIIVTYIFSKLFAEKTIKVERKKEIDKLSIKITYLRKIAFHIKGMHQFWKFGDSNIKSAVDHKYPELTYEEYRGYPRERKFSKEEKDKMDDEIYETSGQSYLALKGLEDGENTYYFFSEFNPKNYSLNDISRYKEYAGSFWYLLDRSDDEIVNFNNVNRYSMKKIDELYFKITKTQIDRDNYKKSIKDLLTEYDSVIFEKHYFLTSMNSNIFPSSFKQSLFNMFIFILILIASTFAFIIDFNSQHTLNIVFILISLFISNTIDLLIIIFQSIKKELNVDEIFYI